MKKGTKLKAFMLSLIMTALLLPMTSFAQQTSDSFFCVDDAFNGNRDVFAFNGLHNQTFGDAPLGSGLLVLGALSAGYAIARRKRNKKGAALLLALALTLGFTQCKKKVEQVVPVNANKVNITLNVDGRHNVTPGGENATVTYEDGDKIYVGDGTHYIGTLTRTSGVFSGDIVEPSDGTKIDFFFVGGLEPSATAESGTTTSFTVDISDQSSNLPVLSCGSAEYYHGTTEYNSELKNKCALVELTLTSGTTDAVGIGDRYTQATINFGGTPGIVPNTSITGMITMKPSSEDNTKKYAILLPQAAVDESNIAIGHVGYKLDVPAMSNNNYIKFNNEGVAASNIVYLNYLTANYTATNDQTLTGTLGSNVIISIADGATVTLDGVSINASGTWTNGNYAGITCAGDATITLEGTNTVKGFSDGYPGIFVSSGKTLVINGTGELNASSNGSYDTGSGGAGIGGGDNMNCGNIEIQSGTVRATGNEYGAGIGGGQNANCGNITISGGTVTATGGYRAAGIGGGRRGVSGTQGGSDSGSCGNINISGGTITATGGADAAGIGGGRGNNNNYKSSCGTITITTGVTQVTATKGSGDSNSIGAGKYGTCGTVTIGGVEGAITTSPYTYPVPLTYPIALGDATSDYVGSVVTTDGYVYATVDAASAASKTAVAIIAYVGTAGSVDASSASYKGLAIALSDANSGSNCKWAESFENCLSSSQSNDITIALGFKNGISCTNTLTGDGHTHAAATAAAINNGTAAPTGTSGWFMPSMGQWNLIVQGLATKKAGSAVTTDLEKNTDNDTYKADNLNSVITDAGGTGFKTNSYWASTEVTFVGAWAIYFTNGYATSYAKTVNYYVRSVIAF